MDKCKYIFTVPDMYIKFYRYEYRWADGEKIKKPIEVSAPKYVELLMDWIEGQLDNESIFPQKLGNFLCQKLGNFLCHIIHLCFLIFICLVKIS